MFSNKFVIAKGSEYFHSLAFALKAPNSRNMRHGR